MIRLNETEEIIRLIHNGFDLELLSFELDIPIEQLQEYKKRLELRQFAKESIKRGKIAEAIDKLNVFIESTDSNIIERTMLLKLKAYANRTNVDEEDLQEIEEERKKLGFSSSIDEILDELKVQIPKRKSSNIRKKEQQNIKEQPSEEEQPEEEIKEEVIKPNYEETINRYKTEIASNPQKAQGKRNLLAFAYFRAGRIEEAKDELMALAEETSSYMAYRQLVHIEKAEGNFEDAKLWAYEAIDKFPNSIEIREQLISIARAEKDDQEIIRQLKDIIDISPENERNKKRLQSIMEKEER
ncbi:MAG: hypothetical protein HFJ33_07875 [Clostridia bacterium]|nr:hypothetical protein [Clostridia bacterium]